MRIALINEGTYPFVSGGVSTWCHQLTTGLAQHAFHLVSIGAYAGRQRPAYPLPGNVAAVYGVPVWDHPVPVSGRLARHRHRRAATSAAVLLCRGLLGDGRPGADMFRAGLRRLAELAAGGAHPLHDVPLAEVLLDAWRSARATAGAVDQPRPPRGSAPVPGLFVGHDPATGHGGARTDPGGWARGDSPGDGRAGSRGDNPGDGRAGSRDDNRGDGRADGWERYLPSAGTAPRLSGERPVPNPRARGTVPYTAIGNAGADHRLPLPRLTMREAREAAVLLEHAIRPLAHRTAPVDVCHAVAAGLPVLVALAAKWRAGVPYLITEHGIYLRERYLQLGEGMPVPVKAVMLRFYRALARLGYAEAGLVSSVSRFNQRWELRHGAHPARVLVVPNGVAPDTYPVLESEPDTPTVVWVGRIDPLKDLHTLIKAFDLIRREVPGVRLRLAGPVPATGQEYADSCRGLVSTLRLADLVDFVGPVSSSREAYATGNVVALSSISEGMPYTVIEAMMCGRATVSTDVGGVAETVGDAGLVVPPGDPAAFAQACVTVLRDPDYRARLATAARERALTHFTLGQMLAAYDHLYTDVRTSAQDSQFHGGTRAVPTSRGCAAPRASTSQPRRPFPWSAP